MFSKSCEYAIRAVIYLSAESNRDNKLGIDIICEKIEAPKHFTAKILQVLSKRHIIGSQKGVNGGFYMDSKQSNKSLIEIVEAIDGNDIFTQCGIGLSECSEKEPCPLHQKFKEIRNQLTQMLRETTIVELSKKLEGKTGFLKSL